MLHQQWHLEARSLEPAGAAVLDAWATTRGSRSTIAIVDDGLERAHADLADNYRASLSRDFNDNDGDPTPATSDAHGTAAAGLAAARGDNGIGVSGVAPRAGLAGLRILGARASDAQVAEALGYLPDDIAIASNSWGPSDNGRTMWGPGPLTRAAIANALTNGRGGKGRVFVWAAGNGGLGDNCNFDGYANNRAMIAVGAATDGGTVASYSEPCAALMVVAPSSGGSRGLVTTDLMDAAGYHASDYTTSFGGTSGAAPIAAGIVALMLDRNPALTWRDVKAILRRTSIRLQSHESDWTPGPYPHHHRYGFGLVDAAAAAAAAATWTPLPPEQMLPAVTVETNVTIPDANPGGVQDTIVIAPPAGFIVEHVEVVLSVAHTYRGDLEVHLTSPSGAVSRLAGRRASDGNDNYASWSFGSIRHWGETAAGPWTLKIADLAALDAGTWQRWTLRIYGRVGGAGQ